MYFNRKNTEQKNYEWLKKGNISYLAVLLC